MQYINKKDDVNVAGATTQPILATFRQHVAQKWTQKCATSRRRPAVRPSFVCTGVVVWHIWPNLKKQGKQKNVVFSSLAKYAKPPRLCIQTKVRRQGADGTRAH